MTFADELKTWRAHAGLTQTQAAAWLSVPSRTYEAWEQGRREPDQPGPIRKLLAVSDIPGRDRANRAQLHTKND